MKALLTDRPKFMGEYVRSLVHTSLSREQFDWLASIGMDASFRACMRGLEELRDRDLRPLLSNIRVPTRYFHGTHDRVIPFSQMETQAGLIKGASLVQFENSGHGLIWDERDKLVDELDKFAGEKVVRKAVA
jgi:pimeloyl-ACP methyl ester carboxylesterase